MRKFLSLLVVLLTTFSSAWADEPEYVVIGGLKWATKNLGATTVAGSPSTCYGNYYAWGETEPRYTNITISSDGTSATFGGWSSSHSSGYSESDYPTYTGTTLDATHDAATQNWGSEWRTPTHEDYVKLYEACGGTGSYISGTLPIGTTSTTAKGIYWCNDYDGVKGLLFSDGTNKVFFPAAGLCFSTGFYNGGSYGLYWSSSLYTSDTDFAYRLHFDSSYVNPSDGYDRYGGLPVRPVSTAEPTAPNYLCFTAEADNSLVTFNWYSGSVQTSRDGTNFNDYTAGTAISLNKGDKVYFKGSNVVTNGGKHFTMSGTIAASGDVTSLTNGTGGDIALAEKCYVSMFQDCTSLTAAPALPATTLKNYCYQNMFRGCTSLTAAPKLPAKTLATQCYSTMFNNCTSLTAAPELPATALATSCYYMMFSGCTSLIAAPALPVMTLAQSCYNTMFYGCTSLTTAPELPAKTLAYGCYGKMFQGCTSLTTAPELPAETLAKQCYFDMFYGCTKLSKVTVKFTDWKKDLVESGLYPTSYWLNNAGTDASVTSHTFICPVGLDVTTTKDASHVPEGWNVVNTQVSTEADLTAAITNAQAGEIIQLTDDIDLTTAIFVASNKNFTLDLNGHVLNQTHATPTATDKNADIIYINEGSTLNITDSNPEAAHTDWNTAHPTASGNADLSSVKGAVLTGGKGYYSYGDIWAGAIMNYGTLTMTGGTITGNSAGYAGAIYNDSGLTMTGVTITGNSATTYGGAIYNFGTLSLGDGTVIKNNTTIGSGLSGGVDSYGYSSEYPGAVSISGKVIITDNTTMLNGQGSALNANLCLSSVNTSGNPFEPMTISDLKEGTNIGITTENDDVVTAAKFTTNGSADDMQYFFSDDDKYAFLYNTGHLETSLITRGDADIDNEATVNDYNKVKNYILTPATTPAYTTKNVLFINADANASNAIDASDLAVIADDIYKDAANKAKAALSQPSPSGQESVEGLTLAVNGNTLTISADNASAFLAAQMDITLPEGITIASAESAGHTVYNKVQEDGSTRVLIAGLQNNQFSGSAIATLTLSGAVNSEQLTVNNGIFTNTAFQSVAAAAGTTTGISAVNSEQLTVNNGKYIENGRVVILKNGKKFNAAGQMMK